MTTRVSVQEYIAKVMAEINHRQLVIENEQTALNARIAELAQLQQ
jgi:hypothetical protein